MNMGMHMSGARGALSIPAEHIPGLIALALSPVAAALLAWLLSFGVRRQSSWAIRLRCSLDGVGTSGRIALFVMVLGAAVHGAIVPTHWAGDRNLAVLFLADALGFLGAIALLVAGSRWWRGASLTMLVGTVAGYVLFLVRGWETADLVGVLTSSAEIVGVVVLAAPATVRYEIGRARWSVAAAIPVAAVTMSVSIIAAGASQAVPANHPGSVVSAGDGSRANDSLSMKMGSSSGATLTLSTSSPAGPVTWPIPMAQMEGGMQMSTPYCTTSPSKAQQQAAVHLVDSTIPALEQFQSLAAAKAAGYFPITPSGLPVVHYINLVDVIKASTDPLDPNAIQSLVYANTSHGGVLVGAMYTMGLNQVGQAPPMPGGCLTEWHDHTNLCFSNTAGIVDGFFINGQCPPQSTHHVTQPMIHVWLAPVPGGPLAVDASNDQIVTAANQLPPLDSPNPIA